MDDMKMLTERLAAKEAYIEQLERQIAQVISDNRFLKAALEGLRDL